MYPSQRCRTFTGSMYGGLVWFFEFLMFKWGEWNQPNQRKTMLVEIFIALNNRSHFHNNFSPYLGPSAASVVTSSVASFPSFLFLGSSSCICFGRRTQSWKQPIINLNDTLTLESHASLHMKNVQKIAVFSYNVLLKSSSGFVHIIAVFTFII